MAERAQIIITGVVQGVGFRPFVFNLAESLKLKGYVTNTTEGVFIDLEGAGLAEFISRLRSEAPPLSRINDISVTNLPARGYPDFSIRKSEDASSLTPFTLVSTDVSVCEDCLREMLDPSDRRHLYPFINCTNCGPRYSITRSVPYDRANTTMAAFTMCPDCLKEYDDPRNRRFHAQPNACPECGPMVEFKVHSSEFRVNGRKQVAAGFSLRDGRGIKNSEAIEAAIVMLKQGGIVAVKGLGGFHIACDASNDAAVRRLREKKRKSNKPFAVMASSCEAAAQFAELSDEERELLKSNRRPVVLLRKKDGCISGAVSPNNSFIGVMLPYTPLHYLLFRQPPAAGALPVHFTALVMTSGNLSEEPIVRDNAEAVQKLSGIVDGFLFHNRDIFMRVDDSVVRACVAESPHPVPLPGGRGAGGQGYFYRRSRGYAPDPIELAEDGPEVLGCGADLKNTFTITKGRFAIPSQHIGDMENHETVRFFEESLENIKAVYRAEPKAIVHDLHPGYLSTQWAIDCGMRSAECGMKTFAVQHHYAHIGSVMAENGLKGKVIGVAFDGTGYGTDGNLWGGEFLVADIRGFERFAQFRYIPLPGGETSIREPWRTAISLIVQAGGKWAGDLLEKAGFIDRYGSETVRQVIKVAAASELSPLASGAGRLFDAVSALLGICDKNTFEGEAAMALEALTIRGVDEEYPVDLSVENGFTVIDFGPCILGVIDDLTKSARKEAISTKFHNTVASVIVRVAGDATRNGIKDVVLSGGTFQNLYLLNRTINILSAAGINVFINQKVPCNDAGISLGQAYLIRERLKTGIRNAECGV